MRTTASIGGHPIHAMLVHLPLGFLTGGFGFDLVGKLMERPEFNAIGSWLVIVGVVAALVVAPFGTIDFLTTVRRAGGEAFRRGALHMLTAVTAVALFTAAWFARGGTENTGIPTLSLILEGLGVLSLVGAGWYGSSLIHDHGIGPGEEALRTNRQAESE